MSDIREAFEALNKYRKAYDEMYQMLGIFLDADEGLEKPDIDEAWAAFNLAPGPVYWKAIEAALSANGGEEAPVGYTGSGSLDAMKQGAEGHIFPSPAPSHPIPLYLGPTVKESLTVQSEPIGYADPDTLADYRAGDRLHMPVYRPDASEEWQSGIPVYLHPAPPSVAVPEGKRVARWLKRALRLMRTMGVHSGWHEEASEGEEILAMLTAAPSPDHSGDANKVVDVECCCENCAQDDGRDHIADAGKVATIPLDPRYQEHRPLITNAMKAAHIGEYSVDVEYPEVDEDGELTGLSVDSGVTIPWDTCKRIYREMAKTAMTVGSATPSVPENEIKAKGIEEAIEECNTIFRLHNGTKRSGCFTAELSRYAARLRTAGDEGEEA